MKTIAFTTALAVALSLLAGATATQAANDENRYMDGILAVVNDEVITVSHILQQTIQRERIMARHMTRDEYRERVNQLRKETLEFLINNELMAIEFEDRGYTLPAEFIAEQLDAVVARETQGDWELFRSQLQDQGMTMDEFKEKLTRRLSADALFEEEVRRKVTVSERDIEEHYRENRDDYTRPESVHLQILKIASEQRDAAAMRERLQAVIQELAQGTPFANIARKYSDHPTAEAGGDMGWVQVDDLNQQFKPVAFTQELGRPSTPIPLNDGIYLLIVRDRKNRELQPLTAVRDEIERTLRDKKQQERYEKFIENLRNKFYVKRFI